MANVAALQRRDVIAISPSQSLKEKGTRIRGDQSTYEQGHGKQSSSDPDQRRRDLLLYFSSFLIKLLMFYRLNTCVKTFSMF